MHYPCPTIPGRTDIMQPTRNSSVLTLILASNCLASKAWKLRQSSAIWKRKKPLCTEVAQAFRNHRSAVLHEPSPPRPLRIALAPHPSHSGADNLPQPTIAAQVNAHTLSECFVEYLLEFEDGLSTEGF